MLNSTREWKIAAVTMLVTLIISWIWPRVQWVGERVAQSPSVAQQAPVPQAQAPAANASQYAQAPAVAEAVVPQGAVLVAKANQPRACTEVSGWKRESPSKNEWFCSSEGRMLGRSCVGKLVDVGGDIKCATLRSS